MDVDLTSAVAAVGGAIAALFAALAAHRSARTANAMLSHEAAVEHRELRQRVLETAQRVVTERARVGEFLEKLRLEVGDHAALTGTMKSSWYDTKVRTLAEAEERLDPLSEDARHALGDEARLQDRSQEELLSLSASLFSDLTELRVIKEKHRDDLLTLRSRTLSLGSKGNR